MRETHCGFPSNSQSLKELKRKGARGSRNTLTVEHSEGRCFSPSDNVTFCDIGTSSGKNFLLRSLGVIFENLECRKNAALSDTLFFSQSYFQHPNPSILRGLKLQRLQKKWSFCRDVRSLSLSLQSKLEVHSSSCRKWSRKTKAFRVRDSHSKHNLSAPFSIPLPSRQNFPPLLCFFVALLLLWSRKDKKANCSQNFYLALVTGNSHLFVLI